jgi:L-iditol 2-dehydrogenase
MDALEAAMLEPLGVATLAVDLAKRHLVEPVGLLGAGPVRLLILQVPKVAGAGEVLVIEPQRAPFSFRPPPMAFDRRPPRP